MISTEVALNMVAELDLVSGNIKRVRKALMNYVKDPDSCGMVFSIKPAGTYMLSVNQERILAALKEGKLRAEDLSSMLKLKKQTVVSYVMGMRRLGVEIESVGGYYKIGASDEYS
jgi:biotin operon repressor